METKIVVGIIGCGRICNNAHINALSQVENIKIKYACDIIEDKAKALKDKFPNLIEEITTDYKKVINDKEVDAVYVLTPNFAHYIITMDALKAGKHVFCEKPITVDYEKSIEMAEAAKKYNKILNIGVCNRYNKSIEILKEMNEKGYFGDIYHVYCSFRSYRCIPGIGGAFTTKSQSGGGVLIDWGVHFLDLILYILNNAKIETVTCDTYNRLGKDIKKYTYTNMWAEDTKNENGVMDVEDFISGYIRTDKASISLNGAWAQNIENEEMFIDFLGDKGGARLTYGGKFTFYSQDEIGGLKAVQYFYNIPNQIEMEDKAFFDSIRTNTKNREYIDNILETMKLLDTLYKSSDAKKEISVKE